MLSRKPKLIVYSLAATAFFLLSLQPLPAYPGSIENAYQEYLAGNLSRADEIVKSLKKNGQALYLSGLIEVKKGDCRKARDYFEKIIEPYPNSYLCSKAQVKLADTYFLEKNYNRANQKFSKILGNKNQANNQPLILLRLAQIAAKQGRWADKGKYSELLKQKYPGSLEIKYINILDSFGNFFTVQVGAFTDRENALNLYNWLSESLDAHVFIVEEESQEFPIIYKVRAGKFKDRYSVEKLAQYLEKEGYPTRIYP